MIYQGQLQKCVQCGGLEQARVAAPRLDSQKSSGLEEPGNSATRLDRCEACTTKEEKDELLLKERGDKLDKEINDIKVHAGQGKTDKNIQSEAESSGRKQSWPGAFCCN